jgi:hypothetical protein
MGTETSRGTSEAVTPEYAETGAGHALTRDERTVAVAGR